MCRSLIIFIGFFLFSCTLPGQSTDPSTISISIFTHSIGIPFKDVIKFPLNLGATIGYQSNFGQTTDAKYGYGIEIGYYKHKHLNHAVFARGSTFRKLAISDPLQINVGVQAGYMLDFLPSKSFQFQEGEPLKEGNGISGSFMAGLLVQCNYSFEMADRNVSPFIRYDGWVQFPYSDFVPVLPHSMLHIGSQVSLKN